MFLNAFEFLGLALLALGLMCVVAIAFRASKVVALESRKRAAQLQIEVDDREHARDVQRVQLGMRYDALMEHSDKMGLMAGDTTEEDQKIKEMLEETERVRAKDIFHYHGFDKEDKQKAAELQREAVDGYFE